MSSSKPCLASMPRAFMMFQTSGLNTGSVRLETLITGFCCACAADSAETANAKHTASAAMPRRDIVDMTTPPGGCFGCGLGAPQLVGPQTGWQRLYSAFPAVQLIAGSARGARCRISPHATAHGCTA